MRSVPTTSLDLTAPDVVADPYPHFAARAGRAPGGLARAVRDVPDLRARGGRARCSATGGSGRLWRDREPLDDLEPFNLLHRNQMMENEPPEHTRLRRPVARAFARGHVERLRPRVRELAAALLDDGRPGRLRRDRGLRRAAAGARDRRAARRARARTRHDLRDWSQAIVRMYEVAPSPAVVDGGGRAPRPTSPAWSASWSPSGARTRPTT